MKVRFVLIMALSLFVLTLSACRNQYRVESYVSDDSYTAIFEGQKVPQDVH